MTERLSSYQRLSRDYSALVDSGIEDHEFLVGLGKDLARLSARYPKYVDFNKRLLRILRKVEKRLAPSEEVPF